MSDPVTVTFADIEAAAARITGHAVETPLVESPALNERIGGRVLLKLETLQRVGAFKFRGAYNRLVQLDADERKRGVVAFSSGNHAQGVALAAKLLGMPALIVMPADAPAMKVANTRGYGAEVKLYARPSPPRSPPPAAPSWCPPSTTPTSSPGKAPRAWRWSVRRRPWAPPSTWSWRPPAAAA
jgi:threonine dehydratase